jgi:hypothetical protein
VLAQRGIEVGERLVEEAELGPAHQGAAERDALALATGEIPRAAREEAVDLQARGDLPHARVDLGATHAGDLEREGDVAVDVEVRIEGVALEDHRRAALLGRTIVDDRAVEEDLARGGALEARDEVQDRGFAAAARADEGDEGAGRDLEIDVPEHGRASRERFTDPGQSHRDHPLTASRQRW